MWIYLWSIPFFQTYFLHRAKTNWMNQVIYLISRTNILKWLYLMMNLACVSFNTGLLIMVAIVFKFNSFPHSFSNNLSRAGHWSRHLRLHRQFKHLSYSERLSGEEICTCENTYDMKVLWNKKQEFINSANWAIKFRETCNRVFK